MEDAGNKKQRANHQQGCEAVLPMCYMLGLWLTRQWAWDPWETILMMTLLKVWYAWKEEVSVVRPHQQCPCVLWGGHTQRQGKNLYHCWYRGEGTFYLEPSKGSAWNKQQIPPRTIPVSAVNLCHLSMCSISFVKLRIVLSMAIQICLQVNSDNPRYAWLRSQTRLLEDNLDE